MSDLDSRGARETASQEDGVAIQPGQPGGNAPAQLLAEARRQMRRVPGTSGLLVPLAIFWLLLTVTTPVFLTQVNLTNLLLQASIVGLLSVGTTIVIITEEIDLSIGAVEGLSAVVAGMLIVSNGVPWPLAIVLCIGVGVLVGVVNGWITTSLGVPSFIVTLATLSVVTGIALQATGGQSILGSRTTSGSSASLTLAGSVCRSSSPLASWSSSTTS